MMKTCQILIAFAVAALCVSCEKNSPWATGIISIQYLRFGGDPGTIEQLTFGRDSIRYYSHSVMFEGETARTVEKEHSVATPAALWQQLTSLCDLSVFSEITDGESRRPVDGLDVIHTVSTATGAHIVTNGYGENYERLAGFFNLVQEQVDAFTTK
jgi:hypothetical protein